MTPGEKATPPEETAGVAGRGGTSDLFGRGMLYVVI